MSAPAEPAHEGQSFVDAAAVKVSPLLDIELGRKRRRLEAAGENRDRPPFDGGADSRRRGARQRAGLEFGDRLQHALARTERDPEPSQICFRQFRQDVRVDLVFAKVRLVVPKPEAVKPLADIVYASGYH